MRPGSIGRAIATAALAVLFAACGATAPSAAPGSSGSAASNLPSQPGATGAASAGVTTSAPDGAVIEGPGNRLVAPAAGLDTLPGHRATLTEAFSGTVDGAASSWSVTTTLQVDDAGGRGLTVERVGAVPDGYPDAGWSGLVAGIAYVVADDQCSASVADADADRAFLEPATFLPGLVGASTAGTGAIDGVAADNLTFDALSLGIANASVASGTASVATSDGHLLRYASTVTGGPDELGEGWSGTLTTTYELSDVGSTEAISIPAGCPPGPINFLVPVDATGVTSAPGQLAFTITGSVKDAVAIVRGGSVIAHWSAGVQVVFDNEAHLAFTAEGLTIDAFVLEVEGGTLVQLTATRD